MNHYCIICDQFKEEAVSVYLSFICLDCEQAIVNTETTDEKYEFFIQQLRALRYKKNA
ncbi:sigma factor G inhibitor Gin [Longirhabdus pacifica]|uniref:sigma factor G inhibitor Gin n=1 Tax=Longirhabdus pacifica TaxID=2305227 RepID=UPI001F0BEF58|nr:sigma factor G inhibitor Gin [Longirhabdus pacifica]